MYHVKAALYQILIVSNVQQITTEKLAQMHARIHVV